MVKQYEVYWVNLDPTVGAEIQKKRPCVILSPNELNVSLKTVIIAPLTTTIREWPSRVKVTVKHKSSQVALDQIRCIDKSRIKNKIEILKLADIRDVKDVLLEIFK